MLRSLSLATLVAAALALAPADVAAQCTNLVGNPPPQFEQYFPNFAKLAYRSNGPGNSDDKVILKKSVVWSPGFAFDPVNTHTVHITLRRNNLAGPVLWSTSIPPSALLWTQTNRGWKYSDPATTANGVRRIKIFDYGVGSYLIKKLVAINTNVTNAPLNPATDNVHALIEIEAAGVGMCLEGATYSCRGNGNSQRCS